MLDKHKASKKHNTQLFKFVYTQNIVVKSVPAHKCTQREHRIKDGVDGR